MNRFEVRAAQDTDLIDIKVCARNAYTKFVERLGKEPAPMHADFADQIASGHVDIAVYDGKFAGYVVFYFEGDHAHLESVAISPEFIGYGVGKRLIEYVENSAKGSGYKAVELYTNEAMTENLAMYPKLGYCEVDRRSEGGFNRVFFRKEV